ncbi:MAG: acyl-CoA dehydrogenase family protein [Proteobacteria bacterium]|nr:acyl-CoA dehydrogenase family protein [Pseudomonadota bacterium]MDA1299347.1 acyl-CoA dehydrogenase family protein [Pseudomonadota bacterium]
MTEFQPPTLRVRAGAVSDFARDYAAETEKLGHVHPAVLDAMQEAGLPQLLKPGSAYTIKEFVDVCGILAEGCMSSGWCNFVWGMHSYLMSAYPAEVQETVWEDPKALISASLAPAGHTPGIDRDGAVVTGRWRFNSGADHAQWLLLGVSQDEGEPHLGLFHRSEFELDDTWQVMGLRGTGSKDAVMDGQHIPAERLMPFSQVLTPYGAMLILVIVGPVIGGAQAAVNEYAKQLSTSHGQSAMIRLSEASAEVDAARLVALSAADLLDLNPSPNGFITARIIRDTAYAARLCNQATRRVFEAAGGSALHESRPIQRIFRDVTAGCAHAKLQWDGNALPYASMLVGE